MKTLPPPPKLGEGQGGVYWHRQRFPCVTASKFSLVMAKPKAKSATWTLAATSYAHEIAAARLLMHGGLSGKKFSEHIRKQGSQATDWGHNYEDEARADYELSRLVNTSPAPFLRIGSVGGSPDGYTLDSGELGIHEIKCPFNTGVHVGTLRNGMPTQHTAQVQGNIWITGSDWCDFISYYPDMPSLKSRLLVQRVRRDEEYIETLVQRLGQFDKYIDSIVEELL